MSEGTFAQVTPQMMCRSFFNGCRELLWCERIQTFFIFLPQKRRYDGVWPTRNIYFFNSPRKGVHVVDNHKNCPWNILTGYKSLFATCGILLPSGILFIRKVNVIFETIFTLSVPAGLSKQCRSWSDATERGVWSGSALFATHPAVLDTSK